METKLTALGNGIASAIGHQIATNAIATPMGQAAVARTVAAATVAAPVVLVAGAVVVYGYACIGAISWLEDVMTKPSR